MSADWTVLELDGLKALIEDKAASVATMFTTTAGEDDLAQEGYIWVAEHADTVRDLHARGDQLLSLRIWSVLRDKVKVEARRGSQTIGLHRLYEAAE